MRVNLSSGTRQLYLICLQTEHLLAMGMQGRPRKKFHLHIGGRHRNTYAVWSTMKIQHTSILNVNMTNPERSSSPLSRRKFFCMVESKKLGTFFSIRGAENPLLSEARRHIWGKNKLLSDFKSMSVRTNELYIQLQNVPSFRETVFLKVRRGYFQLSTG